MFSLAISTTGIGLSVTWGGRAGEGVVFGGSSASWLGLKMGFSLEASPNLGSTQSQEPIKTAKSRKPI